MSKNSLEAGRIARDRVHTPKQKIFFALSLIGLVTLPFASGVACSFEDPVFEASTADAGAQTRIPVAQTANAAATAVHK